MFATVTDKVAAMVEEMNKFEANSERVFKGEYEIVKGGRKYIKIAYKSGSSRSVTMFVEKETGNIFKPASWKAPAKGVRGNVDNWKASCSIEQYGIFVRYMRG